MIPQIIIVLILFIIIEILSYFYQRLFIRFKILRFFLFLGIFIHEFSHYLACKLTLAPVREFRVGRYQGYVIHDKSRIPVVGSLLISLAPLIVGIILLTSLFLWITHTSWSDFWLLFKDGQFKEVNYIMLYLNKAWLKIEISSWQFWFWLFLNLNILAVFVPSKKDLRNIITGLILYGLLSYFWPPMTAMNALIIYSLAFALVLLIFATIILSVGQIFKKIFV